MYVCMYVYYVCMLVTARDIIHEFILPQNALKRDCNGKYIE